MPSILVDHSLCNQDGLCVRVCPTRNIRLGTDDYPLSMDNCISCGQCQAVCPTDALTLHEGPPQELEFSNPKIVSFEDLAKAVKSRRSIRDFKKEPLAPEAVDRLMEVVRWAPTGGNRQLVRWVFVEKEDTMKELRRLTAEWARGQKEWSFLAAAYDQGKDVLFRGAPHLIIAYAGNEYGSTRLDCGIAMTTLELLASAEGIGTCWAGFFLIAMASRNAALYECLGIPEDHHVGAALMMGTPRLSYRRIPKRNPLQLRRL